MPEGSITVIGEKGNRADWRASAVNEIQHWQFLLLNLMRNDEKIKAANYETASVYGVGHPLYYDNVIKSLRGEAQRQKPTVAKG